MGLTRLIPAWPARFTALSRAFQFGEAAGPNLEGPARVTVAPFRTDPTQVLRRNRRAGCAAPRTHAFFKVADGVVSSRTLVKRPRRRVPEAQDRWRTQKAPPPERLGAKHDQRPPRRPPPPGRGRLGGCDAGRSNRRPGPLVKRSRPLWALSILPGRGRRLPRPDRQSPLDPPRPPALRSCSASV